MSENVIFCYSGTGNCLDMAKTIARELGDTDIILMRKEPAVTDVRDAKRVGFVFPCYGGGLPGGVEESLRKIQVGLTAYTFGVCQYAGYMGSGLYKLNSIIPLRYWTAVSHQCTCIWLLPHSVMLPPVTPAMAQRRADKKAKQIAQDVLAQGPAEKARQPAREQRLAEDRGRQGAEVCRQRCVRRLRSVRPALPARQHPHRGRPRRHRRQLHPVPELPAVLPAAGHLDRQDHRPPRALSQPQRDRRGADRAGHPHRLSGFPLYIAARPPELRRAGFPLERMLRRVRYSFPCAGRPPVQGRRHSRARSRRRRAASPAGPSRAAAPCRPGCQRSRARG